MLYYVSMRRASYFTPIYFFTSVLPNCGKTNSLANLAIFLNGQGLKVAILDFAAIASDNKLLKAFPSSIQVQEYDKLSELVQKDGSRFQKNFFFIETDFISYFPVDKEEDLTFLFADTAFKDFLLQLQSTFDIILANIETGMQHCLKISEILSIRRLWRGISPISSIFSNSTPEGMVAIDELLRSSSAFNYQLKENTIILFNLLAEKYSEEANNTTVTASEIRKLFNLPFSYIIPKNIDLDLTNQSLAKVLDPENPAHQIISALYRIISNTSTNFTKDSLVKRSIYKECSHGEIFDALEPHLERLSSIANSRLFVTSSKAELYLEESENSYAIKIRVSQIQDSNLGIYNEKKHATRFSKTTYFSPTAFTHRHYDIIAELADYKENLASLEQALTPNNIYSFDDAKCYSLPSQILQPQLSITKEKTNISPIFIKHDLGFSDIPTLANILGIPKKQSFKYQAPSYCFDKYSYHITGIIPFEIPAEMPQCFANPEDEKGIYKFKGYVDGTLELLGLNTEGLQPAAAFELARTEKIALSLSLTEASRIPEQHLKLNLLELDEPMKNEFGKLVPVGTRKPERIDLATGAISLIEGYEEVDDGPLKLEAELAISALEFGPLVEAQIIARSEDECLDLWPEERELEASFVFGGVEVSYAGQRRVTEFKMHYEAAEIEVKKRAIIRRVTRANRSILFIRPPMDEYVEPEKKIYLVQGLAAGLSRVKGERFEIRTKPIRLGAISYASLLGPSLAVKWLDSYEPELVVHLDVKDESSGFIFDCEVLNRSFAIKHSIIEDSAYLERELEVMPAVNYSFNKLMKAFMRKQRLVIARLSESAIGARFELELRKMKLELKPWEQGFAEKMELYGLSAPLDNGLHEERRLRISTRNMLVLRYLRGEQSCFMAQRHSFGLEVDGIDFGVAGLVQGAELRYECVMIDTYRLKAMDSVDGLRFRLGRRFAGDFCLDRAEEMGLRWGLGAEMGFTKKEEFRMFVGGKPGWLPSLAMTNSEFAWGGGYKRLTMGHKGYEPRVESYEGAVAFRTLFPKIGAIKKLDRTAHAMGELVHRLEARGEFRLKEEARQAFDSFDLTRSLGKYLFQIPLRVQGYRMSNEAPTLAVKGGGLLEDLSSTITYKQRSDLHFIRHRLEKASAWRNERGSAADFMFTRIIKQAELKLYLERGLELDERIGRGVERTPYGIKKISRVELLKWARRTSSTLSARQKVAGYDNQAQ